MGHLQPIDLGRDLTTALHDRLVLAGASFVEQGGHLVLRHGLDPVDTQQRGLTAERLDLLHEPLKEFRRLGRLREDPRRPPQLHGPHALQFSPDPDAMARRRGRKTQEERQPAHCSHRNP